MILFLYFIFVYLVNINHCNELYQTTQPSLMRRYERPKEQINLIRGSSVDQRLGLASDNIVYCKLYNSHRGVVYDGFGRCRLYIDKVSSEHQGYWLMSAAYRGDATFQGEDLFINVIEEGETKTQVQTTIEEIVPGNTVKVTCALPGGHQVQACQFRSPHGPYSVQLVAFGTPHSEEQGITQFKTIVEGSECSVEISHPGRDFFGFWRCAMSTEYDTYYGFFTLLNSSAPPGRGRRIGWGRYDASKKNTIKRVPELEPDREKVIAYKDEPVTVSCSIFAPIKYCYFWAEGGTVFNVYPGLNSSSMEYVGAGFDAGECGLKINNINYTNRRWRCVVALATGGEQSHSFSVEIRERIDVYQYMSNDDTMILDGRIADNELEYCRFVRDIYGSGFSNEDIADSLSMEFQGSLSQGSCRLLIRYPSVSEGDFSPWTIVAKVKGQDELSAKTSGLPLPNYRPQYYVYTSGWEIFGWVLLSVGITGLVVFVAVGPKRHREWLAVRAAEVRERFRKEPSLPNYTTL